MRVRGPTTYQNKLQKKFGQKSNSHVVDEYTIIFVGQWTADINPSQEFLLSCISKQKIYWSSNRPYNFNKNDNAHNQTPPPINSKVKQSFLIHHHFKKIVKWPFTLSEVRYKHFIYLDLDSGSSFGLKQKQTKQLSCIQPFNEGFSQVKLICYFKFHKKMKHIQFQGSDIDLYLNC